MTEPSNPQHGTGINSVWSTEGSLFAFGWLPDKKPISYFTFIVLVLLAFKEKENEILEMYGKSELKLRKIKCD